MDLRDYEDPDAPSFEADYHTDPYAPRARASQEVAAQKRARPTHDTEPLTPITTPARKPGTAELVGGLLVIVLMIGATAWQLGRTPAQPLQITSAPTAAPATIGAYAAPDGLLLGQIEVDRMISPVAHFGSDWLQADVEGSGLVWLRAGDVPGLALTGPDLAPRAAAAPAPQTGQGMTVDQGGGWTPPAEPAAPPAVEPPATGQKEAPDRAARHAAAVARDQQPAHGSK
jgi:hypothetical protein